MGATLEEQGHSAGTAWENRTSDELQSLVRAGIMAGDQYDGAVRELERRARERARQDEETHLQEARHLADEGNHTALLAAAACILAAIAALFWLVLAS